jgi:hypothetical protein
MGNFDYGVAALASIFTKGCSVRLGGNLFRALVMAVKRQFLPCGTDENRQFQLCCYGWKTGNFNCAVIDGKPAISIMV